MTRVPFQAGAGIFSFTTAFTPALRPTQSPIQWVLEVLSLGLSIWVMKLTTHICLVPRLRIHGATPQVTLCLHDALFH
jgi:hypothetical protein